MDREDQQRLLSARRPSGGEMEGFLDVRALEVGLRLQNLHLGQLCVARSEWKGHVTVPKGGRLLEPTGRGAHGEAAGTTA